MLQRSVRGFLRFGCSCEAVMLVGTRVPRYVDAEAMATKLLDSNTERDEAKAVLREIRALMTAETA